MICRINNNCVAATSIQYRELGFGDDVNLNLFPYSIEYTKSEMRSLLQSSYDRWLAEMREDSRQTGDKEPAYLHELGFPPLEALLGYESALEETIRKYLYLELLAKSFPSPQVPDGVLWIINSIDSVTIGVDAIKLSGNVFRKSNGSSDQANFPLSPDMTT